MARQMQLNLFAIQLLLFAITASLALPTTTSSGGRVDGHNIVGVASNILAADVLRANAASNANYVFSPLGFSSILAMLGEGACGETAQRIATTLKHPTDQSKVRAAYNAALGHLQGDSALIAPQFKTWLYVYRNNSVRDEFRRTLHNDYHVEVKDIDRFDSVGWGADDDLLPSGSSVTSIAAGNIDQSVTLEPLTEFADADNNSKDIAEFDTLKVNSASTDADETRLIDDQHDASKFDEVVEDKQYVEVPVIREEIAAQQLQQQQMSAADIAKESILADNNQYVPEALIRDAATTARAVILADELEIMLAQASTSRRFSAARGFGSHGTDEVASVISGNSIVGKKVVDGGGAPDEYESKMILFNGLYYRGSWATPFQQLRSEAANVFYRSDTEKGTAHMMRARGEFKYARLEDARAQAIELPYDNARYALLIIVPNSRTGLANLQSEFTDNTIRATSSQLTVHTVDLSLPKFSIETTGGIEQILAAPERSDLGAMFTDRADFSGISDEQQLHVEELQQHVSVRVDEGASSENFLTAANALRSAATVASSASSDDALDASASVEPLAVAIDRPFLFFVRDVIDDVVIVAGKVVQPPARHGPTSLLLDD